MFFPLCFLAPSLFSCELLLRPLHMKENVAPLEEKKTGDENEEMKAMAWACWLVPLCFLLFMFFPSARPCCALLRPFVSLVFFPLLPLFLPLYFLFILPLTRVRFLSLLKRDGYCCYGWHAHGKRWLLIVEIVFYKFYIAVIIFHNQHESNHISIVFYIAIIIYDSVIISLIYCSFNISPDALCYRHM